MLISELVLTSFKHFFRQGAGGGLLAEAAKGPPSLLPGALTDCGIMRVAMTFSGCHREGVRPWRSRLFIFCVSFLYEVIFSFIFFSVRG